MSKDIVLPPSIASRRELLAVPLLAALPALLGGDPAQAAPDPTMTFTMPRDKIVFEPAVGAPPTSVEEAHLFSTSARPGIYLNLTKWHPGWMSAPHYYSMDRLCVVVSGTWWVTSGDEFDPESTIPMPAGSFVHRIAGTSHYDGVKASGTEPAVIAICGLGPIVFHAVDPTKPKVRKV